MPDIKLIVLCAFGLALWIVSAVVIRGGCMCFRMQRPSFVYAMMTVLMVGATTAALHFLLGMTVAMQPLGLGGTPQQADTLQLAMIVPLHLLAAATIYKFMLSTTFGRAVLVWLGQAMMAVALGIVLTMILSSVQPALLTELRNMIPLH